MKVYFALFYRTAQNKSSDCQPCGQQQVDLIFSGSLVGMGCCPSMDDSCFHKRFNQSKPDNLRSLLSVLPLSFLCVFIRKIKGNSELCAPQCPLVRCNRAGGEHNNNGPSGRTKTYNLPINQILPGDGLSGWAVESVAWIPQVNRANIRFAYVY